MAILTKKRPGANGDNTIQMTSNENWCCDDATPEEANCFYLASLTGITLGTTTATGISIAGTLVLFENPVMLDPANTANLLAAIREAINRAGYTNKDVAVSRVSSTAINVLIGKSAPTFDYIKTSASNVLFTEGCPPYNIEVVVFDDTDNDGTLDGGEAEIVGAIVYLWDNAGALGTPIQTLETDGDGLVTFPVQAGTYWVSVDLTAGGAAGGTVTAPAVKEITVSQVGVITYTPGDWVDSPNYPVVL